MQTQEKFCICFTKINLNIFSGEPKFPLIPKVGPSPRTEKLFLEFQHEMMNCYEQQKL